MNMLDVGQRRLNLAQQKSKQTAPPWRPLDVPDWPTPMCLSVVVAVDKLGTEQWADVARAVGYERSSDECERCWDQVLATKCRSDLRRAVKYRDRKMLLQAVALAKAMKIDSDVVAVASDDWSAELALAEQVLTQLEEVGLSQFQVRRQRCNFVHVRSSEMWVGRTPEDTHNWRRFGSGSTKTGAMVCYRGRCSS